MEKEIAKEFIGKKIILIVSNETTFGERCYHGVIKKIDGENVLFFDKYDSPFYFELRAIVRVKPWLRHEGGSQ